MKTPVVKTKLIITKIVNPTYTYQRKSLFTKVRNICKKLNLSFGIEWYNTEKNGWAVVVNIYSRTFNALEKIFLQLLMGSDDEKELRNFIRLIGLKKEK